MSPVARTTLSLTSLFTAFAVAHCGGTTLVHSISEPDGGTPPDGSADALSGPDVAPPLPPCSLATAAKHRPTPAACATTRPPGINTDAGGPSPGFGCTSDSECTAGTNGRCTPSGHNAGPLCTYDACSTDADCGAGKVCECGGSTGGTGSTGARYANRCLPSNCSTDSDCGPGGSCSPTFETSCGPFNGIVGYFCHTGANACGHDECTNDGDCIGAGGRAGYCAWEPSVSKWVCAYGFCAG